jgi:hypothetical protein
MTHEHIGDMTHEHTGDMTHEHIGDMTHVLTHTADYSKRHDS